MKKYLIILLITGCAIASSAQPKDFQTELYFGAKGGMTFSKVRFYPNVVSQFEQGNTGGIMFRLISEPHIGFQIEVNYTQKGWKEDSIGYARKLNYVSIPIMTHINMGNKALRYTLNLGPEVAFMISEEEKFQYPPAVSPSDPAYRTYIGKLTDTQVDFLFTAGLGMEYHMKNGSAFSLEGRAFYSLPNLFNPKTYPYKVSQGNGAEATFAYMFQFNKKKKARK